MKLTKIYGIYAAAILLAACDSPVEFDAADADCGRVISVNRVSQSGFVSDHASRASFTDSYATVFEEGDRIGLVLVGSDGSQIANVPFSFTADGSWNNDRNQLYLSDVAGIVAYFPFDESLPSDATDAVAVKNSIDIPLDQSGVEAFKAADLLVCEIPAPGAELDIVFTHAFSILKFSPKGTVSTGDREYEYSIALEGLKVNIGDDAYTPCFMNGGYVMIVRDATALQPELFKYSYRRAGEDRATKTVSAAVSTSAGTVFAFPCPPAGGAVAGLGAGDYYCAAADNGQVVIIPAGASAIPDGLVCQGIVFHVMDDAAFSTFAADNGLVAADYPGIDGKHGMIVSLKPGGQLLPGYNAGDIADSEFLANLFAGFDESGNTEVSLGYKLTRMLVTAYGDGNAGVAFGGLEGFSEPLTYCTGWYVPSFNELKYLIRGSENSSVVSVAGQDMINSRMTVASGILIEGNQPSVSYKAGLGFCIMQNGEEMGWHGVPDGEKCRPICAF